VIVDTAHREIVVDMRTGDPANASTPESAIRRQILWEMPYEYLLWAEDNGIPQPPTPRGIVTGASGNGDAAGSDERGAAAEMAIRLTSPDDQRVYRLDPRLPAEVQRVAVTAAPGVELAAEGPTVTLLLDGNPLARLEEPDYTTWWQLQAGRHTFQAAAVVSGGRQVVSAPVTVLIQ
jgi:hypothetical protein